MNLVEKSTLQVLDTHILLATDLHYLASDLTDKGEYFQRMLDNGDGKTTQYVTEITDAFLKQVIDQRPDVLLLSGDLTFNGAKDSHLELAGKLQKVVDSGIPVLVIPGNHDLDNRQAASFSGKGYSLVDTISANSFASIYANFGYKDSLSYDKISLSYMYQINAKVRVLMVDVNTKEAPGKVTGTTLDWIEQQLVKAAKEKALVIAVSHQPLLEHSSLFSDNFTMENSKSLLALYEKYQVVCNLSGHMHFQHIATSAQDFPEIVTSALAITPNQYGVMHLGNDTVEYHTVQTDVSSIAFPTAKLSYPYEYFWGISYEKALGQIKDEFQAPALAQYFADVNTAYFTGTLDSIDWSDSRFAQWKQQKSFLGRYFMSIKDDASINYNQFAFSLPQTKN
jgi:predicted MPP superfamily phosphohydrolase